MRLHARAGSRMPSHMSECAPAGECIGVSSLQMQWWPPSSFQVAVPQAVARG